MLRTISKVLLALLAALALPGYVTAATILLNTSLTSPPGVYFGGGNANSNFAVSTDGTTELGASIIMRHVGPINPGPESDVYAVPTGTDIQGRSLWGFTFSVNTQYNGGSAVLGDFAYTLNVTDLTTANVGPTFDPIRGIPDNTGFGTTGKTSVLTISTQWGAQNSETPSFAGFLPGFDPNAHDVYQITLSQQTLGGDVLQTVSVLANATGGPVPEPATFGMIGIGLVALVLAARKRAA